MPGKSWENWQIERLRTFLAKGLSASEMRIGKRTTAAIQHKASRMDLVGDGIARHQWSPEDEQTLCRLIVQGWTAKQIAEADGVLPGYSRNAIVKKGSRLNLADNRRSQRAKQAIRFSEDRLRQFHVFLQSHAARCTPEQISLLWNQVHEPKVTRRRVVYHLENLKIKLPWKEVMKLPFSKAKQRRPSLKKTSSQQRRWTTYREELEQRLRDQSRKMRRGKKRVKERVCRDCNRRWPATEPFFAISAKKIRKKRRVYVGRVCKLCRNKRRRHRDRSQRAHSVVSVYLPGHVVGAATVPSDRQSIVPGTRRINRDD